MPFDNNAPNPVDVHVGARMRLRRKLLRLSQQSLADEIELTFQQVQKYERGSNRISASKLFAIAKVLRVSIGYFYEGLGEASDGFSESELEQTANSFLATAEGIQLAEVFPRIISPKYRLKIMDLIRALADDKE